jgi:2-polyprenyl-3-methyl-5-hydroxy-6-metoxy-1,4-benzoquinol methylase
MNLLDRASEISTFLDVTFLHARNRLEQGFHYNHHLVAEDFIKANVDVNDPVSLLNWYRRTDAYIWELSAYHLDPGFNYSGMCEGISLGLKAHNKKDVLSLGDGIGDLTIRMHQDGLSPTYNDLKGSHTAGLAQFRFELNCDQPIKTLYTEGWTPSLGENTFDAVVALDFFEHVVNVDEWALAVYKALRVGGVFIAQNAFAIGDAEHGNSIPMHLSINNKYEKDWDPMLGSIGFIRHENGQWWVK